MPTPPIETGVIERTLVAIACALTVLLGGCGPMQPNDPAKEAREAARASARTRQLRAACASKSTYDRLKQVAFDDAIHKGSADPKNLEILSAYAFSRVEDPVVKSHDDNLDVTVCTGRLVLQLPPGAERGFGGDARLVADIEYAAQAAADGSGLVYRIKGAEPIVARLAAFNLKGQTYRPPVSPDEPVEVVRREEPEPAARPTEVAARSPQPIPQTPPAQRMPTPARATTTPPPRATARPEARQASAGRASPSFNCRYARTPSERMVCGSGNLAALDRSMASQYYAALSEADARTRAALRRSRDRFLAWRERCRDEDCVARTYRDRMDEIDDIARGE